MADLLRELGDIPAERVRIHPTPGSVERVDLDDITKSEGIYELVYHTMVRKPMGDNESLFALLMAHLFHDYLRSNRCGLLYGETTHIEFTQGEILSPDLSFVTWDRLPEQKRPQRLGTIIPNLVIEVLSQSNTAGEMRRKRVVYFQSSVEQVWEVDIELHTLTVYHNVDEYVTYTRNDTVLGEPMLPEFVLSLSELFTMYDIQG